MYPVSRECYNTLFSPSRRMTARAVITTSDGTFLRLTAADFKSGGIKLSEATSGSGSFDLGGAVISKLTLTLNNSNGRFNAAGFVGGEVNSIQIGVTLPDDSTEWIPLGMFDIDSVRYTGTAAELVAYDHLVKADKELPPVALPMTAGALLRAVCTHCGIIYDGGSFLHDDYSVDVLPDSASCRDVISWIAQIAGCYARMSRDGKLTLGWYGENTPLWDAEDWLDGGSFIEAASGDVCDGGDFLGDIEEEINGGAANFRGLCVIQKTKSIAGDKPLTVTGIVFTAPDREITELDGEGEEVTRTVPGETFLSGTEGYCFDLSDNPLLTHEITDVLDALGDKLIGETFNPLKVSCTSNPALEPGDMIRVTDRQGRVFTGFINRSDYQFGAPQSMSCEAPTESERQAASFASAARLERRIAESTRQKIDAYNARVQTLNNLMYHALGVYKTAVTDGNGGIIYYTHDKPTLAASSFIACESANGYAFTTSGWNDGAPQWQYGQTADGNLICNVLSAVGIVADWIQAGRVESADGSCYFDLDNNQLFASKIGLPTRYLSSGNVSTDTGESRAGIACFDETLSDSPYMQVRPVQAQVDGTLMGFGLADQRGRIQLLCAARADNAVNNAVALYGYDASGGRHELLAASAANGGIKLSSMNGQNRIEITDSGISVYSNGTLVQSW